ncbi:uncharacterized protein J3R85_004290 [Psidium guajava]|nr:uncharacterized protein J3R85_004290 [Psidium guajava]
MDASNLKDVPSMYGGNVINPQLTSDSYLVKLQMAFTSPITGAIWWDFSFVFGHNTHCCLSSSLATFW